MALREARELEHPPGVVGRALLATQRPPLPRSSGGGANITGAGFTDHHSIAFDWTNTTVELCFGDGGDNDGSSACWDYSVQLEATAAPSAVADLTTGGGDSSSSRGGRR